MESRPTRRLREGDHVVAVDPGGMRISGSVEETAPHLDAVWVRENGFGARYLILAEDVVKPPAGDAD